MTTVRLRAAVPTHCIAALVLTVGVHCQTEWTSSGDIPGRVEHCAAYDSSRQRMVVFGGISRDTISNETHEWDGTIWHSPSVQAHPPARLGSDMVYDSKRRRVVLFGGIGDGLVDLDDTWAWDGLRWTRLASTGAKPGPRRYHKLAYDSARDEIVLFGGSHGNSMLADTWVFDGSAWARRSPSRSPSARRHSGMAYDPTRGRVVLFGGTNATRGIPSFSDTWEWDGTQWISIPSTNAPPDRHHHALTFDAARGRVLLAGGILANYTDDAWEWTGRQWERLATYRPEFRRSGHSLVFDDRTRKCVLYGGSDSTTRFLADAWHGSGTSWSKLYGPTLPPRAWAPIMAYDASRDRTVALLNGYRAPTAELWEHDGSRWQQVHGLSPRGSGAMTSGAGVVLYHGGGNDMAVLSSWDGSNWRIVSHFGPRRSRHAMAYDRARQRLVMFGGYTDLGKIYDDTWEFDGSRWIQHTPSIRPLARQYHGLVYDPARRVTVLFGGHRSDGWRRDTWEWNGSGWTERHPITRPPAVRIAHLAYDTFRERVVLFGNTGDAQNPNYQTWEWDGQNWARRAVTGPNPTYGCSIAYDSRRRNVLMYDSDAQTLSRYRTTAPATIESFGSGCSGSAGVPSLSASGYPWADEQLSTRILNAPPGRAIALGVGLSKAQWGPLRLPLPLDQLGMPGCVAWAAMEVSIPGSNGRASFVVPNTATSIGTEFFLQGIVVDPAANAFGVTVSNALAGRVGAK